MGSYGYVDANGIFRKVYYVADENGFRVKMDSNEPGMRSDLGSNTTPKKTNTAPNVINSSHSSIVASAASLDESSTDDGRKSASSLGSQTGLWPDKNWLAQDFQRVQSKPSLFSAERAHSEIPDSRLPLQYAVKMETEKQKRREPAYPVHLLTSPLSSSSLTSHAQPQTRFVSTTYKPNDNLPRYSDAPKSESQNLGITNSASTVRARHRPQYENVITAEAASSHPPHVYPPSTDTNLRHIKIPIAFSSPPVSSDTLYIREQPVTAKLTNRPVVETSHPLVSTANEGTIGRSVTGQSSSGQSLYPPYEYQYQLPNRVPTPQSEKVAFNGGQSNYAPPLPSPKPYEEHTFLRSSSLATKPPLLAGFRPLPSNQHLPSKLPRNYRLLANAGLISVHELDDHSSPYRNHSHNQPQYYQLQPSFGTRYPLEPPPSSAVSSSRPMIDYDRYRQLIRSKLPLRNIAYRGQYQPMGRLSPLYAYNLTDRPTDQAIASGYDSINSNYSGGNPATDSESHTNAPLFFSRYANREQLPVEAYYDRFKEAEFAPFRPPSPSAASTAGTSGRSAGYEENTNDHKNPQSDSSYASPDSKYRQDPLSYDPSYSSLYPQTTSSASQPTYPLTKNSAPSSLSYPSSSFNSVPPKHSYYERRPPIVTPNSLTSSQSIYPSSPYSPTPPPTAYTLPAYRYSLAPPPLAVTTAPVKDDNDLDLYNPQGAVQLSVKKRIANRYRNVPFSGNVRMPSLVYDNNRNSTSSTHDQGYIAADANHTVHRPLHVIDSPEQFYRYAASDYNPTINHFKSGLKQLFPLLGSESFSMHGRTNKIDTSFPFKKSYNTDVLSATSTIRSGKEVHHSGQLTEFNKADLLTYQSGMNPKSIHLRFSDQNVKHSKKIVSVAKPEFEPNGHSTNLTQSASSPIVDVVESVRTSNLVKAFPLGRVQVDAFSVNHNQKA